MLAIAGSLLLGAGAVTTPGAAASPRESVPSAATVANDTTTGRVPVEADDAVSNTPAGVVTNEEVKPSGRRVASAGSVIVRFGQDVELKEGETAEVVVVIGGSATIRGKVTDAAVAIFGDVAVTGEVRDAVVAVLGSVKAGPGARIHGDAVAVGGKVEAAEGAVIKGQKVEISPPGLPKLDWLRKWLVQCVFKLRPLAPQVGWVWAVWGAFVLLYLLVGAVFPRSVAACVEGLTGRPATTFLMGVLTKLLLPVVVLILLATGIGVLVVPFLMAALALGAIVGKAALLQALGLQLGRQFGGGVILKPLAGFLIGAVLITLLYVVPVLGMVTFGVISVWALGGAVTAAFGGLRKELPARPPAPPPAAALAVAPVTAPAPGGATEGPSPAPAGDAPLPAQPPATTPPEALAYPRVGFWQRMGAGFLDLVLVGILSSVAHSMLLGWLVALAYFAGMWTWKGTTVGGIVLGLKVVRLDGQPVTFAVALVRALAAAFSVVVLFLGFLWIAWDPEKQGWHDRIAGTVVVRLPKGMPLVCL